MWPKLSCLTFAFVITAVLLALFGISHAIKTDDQSTGSYWSPVEHALGKNGTTLPGGIFKVDLTRDDVSVMMGEVRLKPAMALDSWISFLRMGNGAMMMGDLVLTADEMGPVQDKLSAEGINITAIHNTLIGESPQVYDLHIGGQGDPADMARKVHDALRDAGVPYGGAEITRGSGFKASNTRLDRIIGYGGKMEDGIYSYEVPRAEAITVDGMEMPPSMDVASIIKFQPLGGGRAAITGDLLLRPNEVNPVILALNENNITATALHTHMLTEEPRLFMLHFWATGDEGKLARGLRTALDKTNSKK